MSQRRAKVLRFPTQQQRAKKSPNSRLDSVQPKMLPCSFSPSSQERKCQMCMQLVAEKPKCAAVIDRLVVKFLSAGGVTALPFWLWLLQEVS